MRRLWVSAVILAAVPVYASPPDVLGFTSRRAGQANAGVAAADDASALYYNPAGLAAAPGGDLVIGALATYSHLGVGTEIARLRNPFGFQLAGRVVLADRVALGLGLHLLPRDLSVVRVRRPEAPFYPVYGDRLSRAVVLPGIAVRLGHGVALGASANVLDTVRALVGIGWTVTPRVRIGAVYRQRYDLPVQRVFGDLLVRGTAQFTPHQIAAGVSHTAGSLVATLDVTWAHWADYPGPFTRPALPYRDTLAVRAGIDDTSIDGLVLRGGYALETSPIPREQAGITNLLDGTRHVIAGGIGYAWPRALAGHPLRIEAHVQLHVVATRTLRKQVWDGTPPYDPATSIRDDDPATAGVQTTNPGYPELKSGGEVISAGISVAVGL